MKGMRVDYIEGLSIPDVWFQCIWNLLDFGTKYKVAKGGSFEGQYRLEFPFVVVKIDKPYLRPLAPDIPKHLGLPNAVDMIEGDETPDDAIMRYFQDYLYNPNIHGTESYTYGNRLLAWHDDQVAAAVEMHRAALKEQEKMNVLYSKQSMIDTPNFVGTNQATMEIGMPGDIELKSPPCLRLIDTKIWEGKLWFYPYFRSWDLWGGFPTNLGGLQLLKEYMAEEIGVEDGGMICMSKGLHLYDHCWKIAEIRKGEADKSDVEINIFTCKKIGFCPAGIKAERCDKWCPNYDCSHCIKKCKSDHGIPTCREIDENDIKH